MEYYIRIKEIRKSQKITQDEIANKLNIKRQQYGLYENGTNIMSAVRLKEICKILNVSADYILGLTDECKPLK